MLKRGPISVKLASAHQLLECPVEKKHEKKVVIGIRSIIEIQLQGVTRPRVQPPRYHYQHSIRHFGSAVVPSTYLINRC